MVLFKNATASMCQESYHFVVIVLLPDMFLIREKAGRMLSKLVPKAPKTSEKKGGKMRKGFNESDIIESTFPLVTLLFERSPCSNLVMSPKINVRQVEIGSYSVMQPNQHQTFSDAIYDINSANTFRSRNIILSPYKIVRSDREGLPLVSLSRGPYRIADQPDMSSTSVYVANAVADVMKADDFRALCVLFDVPLHTSDTVQNWEDLFKMSTAMSNNEHLMNFILLQRLPERLINIEWRFECNLLALQQFVSMCTPVRICAPEGQHRLECATRVCYSLPLLGTAPLANNVTKIHNDLTDMDQRLLRDKMCTVPESSPVYVPIGLTVVYTHAQLFTNVLANDMREIIKDAAKDA